MIKRNKWLIFIGIIIFILFLSFFIASFYTFKIPLRNQNYDYYSTIGIVSGLENYVEGSLNQKYFPDALIITPHTNLLTFDMLLIKIFTNIDLINMSFIISIFSILLLIFSSFLFMKTFLKNNRYSILGVLLLLIIFSSKTTRETISVGLFNIGDITIRTFSYQIFAFSVFLILIFLIFRYFNKESNLNLLLIFLLSFFLFNLHLQVFFVLLVSIPFIFIEFKDKCPNFYKKSLFLLLIFFSIFLLSLLWPFYNWFLTVFETFFEFQKGLIASGSMDYYVNHFSYYLEILSFSLIGFIFLFREKNKFLKYWILAMSAIILFSLIDIGIKIPLFYRFILFIKLGLIVIITKNINFLRNKKILYLFIFILVTISFIFMNSSLDIAINQHDSSQLYYKIKNLGITNSIILSDPITSNLIQSTNNYVLFIPEGHIGDPMLLIKNNERIEKSKYEMTQDLNRFVLNENISYIVIDKSLNPSFINLEDLNYDWKNLLYEDEKYKIMRIEIK